jgi:tRNA U34 5-carboxymethylaminomethyl modifying enzyme MnmG/GidA
MRSHHGRHQIFLEPEEAPRDYGTASMSLPRNVQEPVRRCPVSQMRMLQLGYAGNTTSAHTELRHA